MGTHLIPRANVKGQDRLFIFFSFQGLIGTLIGVAIGFPLFSIINSVFGQTIVAIAVLALFGGIGFAIGQVKVPDNNGNALFRKVGGLYIRDVLLCFFKFRANKKKYVIQVADDEIYEEHKESKLEKFLLNRDKDNKSGATE